MSPLNAKIAAYFHIGSKNSNQQYDTRNIYQFFPHEHDTFISVTFYAVHCIIMVCINETVIKSEIVALQAVLNWWIHILLLHKKVKLLTSLAAHLPFV